MQWQYPTQALGPIRCYGQQDEHRQPICDGPDVRHVRVHVVDGSTFTTAWCSDCRADATTDGIMVIADTLPSSEYFARLARASNLLGPEWTPSALESHREAQALDVEAELTDIVYCGRCGAAQQDEARCHACGRSS